MGALPAAWCKANHFKEYAERFSPNDTHNVVRCNACLAHAKAELLTEDTEAVERGVCDRVRTEAELDAASLPLVKRIAGRGDRMTTHLKTCPDVDPTVKAIAKRGSLTPADLGPLPHMSRGQQRARAALGIQPLPNPNLPTTPPLQLSIPAAVPRIPALHVPHIPAPSSGLAYTVSPLDIPRVANTVMAAFQSAAEIEVHRVGMWEREQQEQFARDVCRLLVSCNWSWNCVSNPEFLLFFSKYVPEAKIPDRDVLSGRILDTLTREVEAGMKEKVRGKWATGQCDGWKSIAKDNIITTSSTVEGKWYLGAAHDVSPERKTAAALLEIVDGDMTAAEEQLLIQFIGYCTDNGGDAARGMRARLKRRRKSLLVSPCWAHQINLIVGELLGLDIACIQAMDIGLGWIKWIVNHSRALGMLKAQQKQTELYAKTHRLLTLIFPVISRWTSHFVSLRRLLVLSGPLRALYLQSHQSLVECAGDKRAAVEKAEDVLELLDDTTTWKRLAEAKILLEPLAIAAKCFQAVDLSLDVVLLILGNLYFNYDPTKINPAAARCVRASLEKRWAAVNREHAILTLYLNPLIRGTAFDPRNLAVRPISIYAMATRACKQIFSVDADLDFHAAFGDYGLGTAEFSAEFMQLEQLKALHKREGKHLHMVTVWKPLDTGELKGRNLLVQLAIALASFTPTSAGSERGFSRFGLLLTKLRSRMSIEKVRKMTTLSIAIQQEHEAMGLRTDRIKRRFVEVAEECDERAAAGVDGPQTFAGLAEQLVGDVSEEGTPELEEVGSDEEEDTEEDATAAARPQAASSLTLKSIFNWPRPGSSTIDKEKLQNALGFYWVNGIKSLDDELAAYELLSDSVDV
ncbi:HAT family dimerization protein [Mycena kentingensis (nom. inval.)]|nr:HAT family dimerization protein [Mycena kentingensis (nom. inval.)]